MQNSHFVDSPPQKEHCNEKLGARPQFCEAPSAPAEKASDARKRARDPLFTYCDSYGRLRLLRGRFDVFPRDFSDFVERKGVLSVVFLW